MDLFIIVYQIRNIWTCTRWVTSLHYTLYSVEVYVLRWSCVCYRWIIWWCGNWHTWSCKARQTIIVPLECVVGVIMVAMMRSSLMLSYRYCFLDSMCVNYRQVLPMFIRGQSEQKYNVILLVICYCNNSLSMWHSWIMEWDSCAMLVGFGWSCCESASLFVLGCHQSRLWLTLKSIDFCHDRRRARFT